MSVKMHRKFAKHHTAKFNAHWVTW